MAAADIIIIAILAVVVFLILKSQVGKARRGECTGGCSGCAGGCSCGMKQPKEKTEA